MQPCVCLALQADLAKQNKSLGPKIAAARRVWDGAWVGLYRLGEMQGVVGHHLSSLVSHGRCWSFVCQDLSLFASVGHGWAEICMCWSAMVIVCHSRSSLVIVGSDFVIVRHRPPSVRNALF